MPFGTTKLARAVVSGHPSHTNRAGTLTPLGHGPELTFAEALTGPAVYARTGRELTEGVTVFMAHYNTRAMSELAIRSLRLTCRPDVKLVVGDSGSTDGTRQLLSKLEDERLIQRIDLADRPKKHWEWLDDWRQQCATRYAVFVDSDVRFRRPGWLDAMVSVSRLRDAAIIAGEQVPEQPDAMHAGHLPFHFAWRPSPWLMLLDLTLLDDIVVGLQDWSFETEEVGPGLAAFDVGGAIAHAAVVSERRVLCMPEDFRQHFVHYGGMSWRRSGSGRKMLTRSALACSVAAQLAWARRRSARLCVSP